MHGASSSGAAASNQPAALGSSEPRGSVQAELETAAATLTLLNAQEPTSKQTTPRQLLPTPPASAGGRMPRPAHDTISQQEMSKYIDQYTPQIGELFKRLQTVHEAIPMVMLEWQRQFEGILTMPAQTTPGPSGPRGSADPTRTCSCAHSDYAYRYTSWRSYGEWRSPGSRTTWVYE